MQFDATDKADPNLTRDSCSVNCVVTQVVPINIPGYPSLRIVVGQTGGQISGMAVTDRTDVVVGTKISTDELFFASRKHSGGRVSARITYSYPQQTGDQSVRQATLTEGQFQAAELSTIPMAILKSLSAK